MGIIIEVKGATKKFKDTTVFRNINLQIEEGKSYGFIGHNGSGKSVFFKTLCGYSLLSDGKIIYKGKVIGKDQDFIDNTGIVIETPDFLDDLSGFKNLKILAEIRKIISNEDILNVMLEFDLLDVKDKKVSKYSLGMKQKLRLAQAIMEKPQMLILDEPMNGLDKRSVEKVKEILHNFIKEGGTLLMTSHNSDDINDCCEYVYEFDDENLIKI